MTDFTLHGRSIASVFQLLGTKEDDITYSVGWALANAPAFLDDFVGEFFPESGPCLEAAVHLQRSGADGGFTDIEILTLSHHVIVEAKRGHVLPNDTQLLRYAPRLAEGRRLNQKVVVAAEWLGAVGEHHMGRYEHPDVIYRSWHDLARLALESSKRGRNHEKRLLRELVTYLESIVSLQDQTSNLVHVVALGAGKFDGVLAWKDIVYDHGRFFHPIGRRYPKEPVNYIGFRYDGRLQSIHHVDAWEIITSPHDHFPMVSPDIDWSQDPHYLYTLGPAIRPPHLVRSTGLYANAHCRATLDLLLTCDTIKEARDRTKERIGG